MNKIGYTFRRQKGSHMVLGLDMPPYTRLTVPDHAELPKGTLRSIIRAAGLTVEEFKELL